MFGQHRWQNDACRMNVAVYGERVGVAGANLFWRTDNVIACNTVNNAEKARRESGRLGRGARDIYSFWWRKRRGVNFGGKAAGGGAHGRGIARASTWRGENLRRLRAPRKRASLLRSAFLLCGQTPGAEKAACSALRRNVCAFMRHHARFFMRTSCATLPPRGVMAAADIVR